MPQVQVKEKTSTKKQEVKQRRKVTKSSTQRSNRVEDKQSNSAQASQ
ncbi:MAG: hypothetical protein IJ113_04610 [Eggerthellaceae bacterium]|nr:hypothetical protein [Eggerthellaceae bacterium]